MRLTLLFCYATLALSGQESRIAIDNDQVKVLDVLQQPHQKTKLHEHKVNRVMIYLMPGKQDLISQAGKKTVLTWTAGEAKWSPAGGLHTAEITSDNPVRIIEIELKKPAGHSVATANPLDPIKVDPKHYKVAFENDQVRVLRVRMGAHESAPMHKHTLNRVVVYLTDQTILVKGTGGSQTSSSHKAGEISYAGQTQHEETNAGDQPFELYAVELKN